MPDEPFRFGPDCGTHCGQFKKGKIVHCDTCHTLTRDTRKHEEGDAKRPVR